MSLSEADWARILIGMGVRPATAAKWALPCAEEWQPGLFSRGMDDIRAMLPQVLHECSMFERLEENLSYSPERICAVWPSRFPTLASAVPYTHSPQKLANKVYGGRMGNTGPDDGWKYRGMGPPMFTGLATYRRIGELVGQDLESLPQLVLQPRFGLEITRRWWEGEMPDAFLSDQAKIRRIHNGGLIGIEHVQALAEKLETVLA
jgi:putative chitinase